MQNKHDSTQKNRRPSQSRYQTNQSQGQAQYDPRAVGLADNHQKENCQPAGAYDAAIRNYN